MDIVDRLARIINSPPTAYGIEIRDAYDEIKRLRSVLVEANNSWRHSFEQEVIDATARLFKRLSAQQTDPFARKIGTPLTADHPLTQAALKEDMPLA